MLDKILDLDSQLLVYLAGLGSERYDWLWLIITNQLYWTPLFLALLYCIHKKIGTKQTLVLLLFIAVLVLFTDQTCNWVKNTVQRLRPCNNLDIQDDLRIIIIRKSFSFFSGHAANSMAVATFIYLTLRTKFKNFGFIFIWPLIFAYSRIYLALHYPLDILSGYVAGALFASLLYVIYKKLKPRYFPG